MRLKKQFIKTDYPTLKSYAGLQVTVDTIIYKLSHLLRTRTKLKNKIQQTKVRPENKTSHSSNQKVRPENTHLHTCSFK